LSGETGALMETCLSSRK